MYNSGFRTNKKTPDGVGTVASQAAFVQKSDPSPTILSWSIQGSDDRALDPAGGQTVVVNGAGFTSGMTVTVGTTAIGAVTIVNSTRATFTSTAKAAGNYTLTMANSNGQAAILVPGLAYSTVVTWTTPAGSLGSTIETTAFDESVVASADSSITYTVASGSLPVNATLNGNGTITGTAAATDSPTTYSFSVTATDAELQDSTQSFTITVNPDSVTWVSPANGTSYSLIGNQAIANVTLSATAASGSGITYAANALPTGVSLSGATISGTPTVAETVSTLLTATANTTNRSSTETITWTVSLGDIYWPNVSMLLNGATPTPSFINDASLLNNAVTIIADTKPNLNTPYAGGYYSLFNNGTGQNATVGSGSTAFNLTGDFTIEAWVYPTSFAGDNWGIFDARTAGASPTSWLFSLEDQGSETYKIMFYAGAYYRSSGTAIQANKWTHVVAVRNGSALRFFVNGVLDYYNGSFGTAALSPGSTTPYIGSKDSGISTYKSAGYISNLRLVNGTAVYTTEVTTVGTSVFTSSTTPLTAVANTTLLTCQSGRLVDNSPNNFVIASTSTAAVYPSSAYPFVTPTTSSYNTRYSTYFDGTGDYLSAPSNTAFAFGTGDYTLEFWVYSTIAFSGVICLYNNNSGGYFLQYNTGTGLQTGVAGSSATGTYATTLTANSWNHIAVSRASGSSKCFVNGTQVGTTVSDSTNYAQNGAYIGALYNGDQPLRGYISNLRVVKGTALYTSNFTPSTTPLTAISGTSLLTCQNATLIDNSTNALTITSVGQAQPIALSPFTMTTSSTTVTSLGSAYFDGTGDFLKIADESTSTTNLFALTDKNFTYECWVNFSGYPGGNEGALWNQWYGVGGQCIFTLLSSGYLNFTWDQNGTGGTSFSGTTRQVPLNSWAHVAIVRNNGTFTLYVNGLADGTTYNIGSQAIDYYGGYNKQPSIAARAGYGSAGAFTGYIADFRVTIGTAVYTSNFLPPQSPLTAITNSKLLTLQYNGGGNNNGFVDQSSFNNVITRAGNPTQGTFSPYSQTGWSTYYNGSNSYQYVPTNTAFAIGTADFTVEAWVYPTTSNQQYSVIFAGISYGSSSDWGLYLNESTISSAMKPSFLFANGGSAFSSGTTVSVGAWTHIAVARQGTTVRFFINGALTATTTSNASLLNSMQKGIGGGFNGNGNTLLTGYISNLRVVSGTAVYTSAFTPPTSPLTPIAGTILLTNQNNRWIDNSSNNFAITTGGTPTVQAYSPFGGVTSVPTSYSTKFDGTSGAYFTFTGKSSLALGTGDFTIESWVYRNTTTGASGSVDGWYTGTRSPSASGGLGIKITSAGQLSWNTNTSYGAGTTAIPAFTWTHIAVTRQSGTLKWYINGVLDYTVSMTNDFSNPTVAVGITDDPYYSTLSISNFRLVTGLAVYTGNFTVPTGPLTATQSAGTNIAAITTQTALLTCQNSTLVDNSSTPATVTQYGTAQRQITFNPFGVTNTSSVSYTPAVNGGSMYFDGTGDYLSMPSSSSGIIGQSSATVEFWIYPTSVSGYQRIVTASIGSLGSGIFCIRFNNGTFLAGDTGNGITSSTLPLLNAWNHVAWVGTSGSTQALYINGINVGTATTYNLSTAIQWIGGYYTTGPAEYTNGYLSDVRITKGVALYTSNFYPGPAPATPTPTIGASTYSSTLLLSGTSGGIIDYHGSNDLETVGDAQLAPQDPYGGGYYSNFSDGNADYLTVPSASWTTLAGAFTVEFWVNWTYAPQAGSLMGVQSNGGWALYNDGTRISPNLYGSANIFNSTFLVSSIVLGQWYHIAITRDSNNLMTMWVNGVSVGSATTATTYTQGAWAIFSPGNVNALLGYISNHRVTNTCLYTTTFTPSTTPLTAVTGTKLLTCQSNSFKDNSTNAATLTAYNTVAVKSFNPFQNNTGKSLYFDGTGDRVLTEPGPLNSLGSGNFTIEGWIYNITLPTNARTLSQGTYTTGEYLFIMYAAGGADFTESTTARLTFPSGSFKTGQWQYFTIVRNGSGSNNLTAYINGVSVATATSSYNYSAVTSTYVGSNPNTSSQDFNGYIKDLRITKGVARYTTSFTPPTTPDKTI